MTKIDPSYPKDPKNNPSKAGFGTWCVRILACLLVVLLVLVAGLFYLSGTQKGTSFLLDKVAQVAPIHLTLQEGNLKDGLWVKDVAITPNDDITIKVDRAYIQMGWKSLFYKQLHLINPQIDTLTIHNKKPSSSEPFDYPRLSLPMELSLDNVQIKKIRYEQTGSDTVEILDVAAKSLVWSDTKLSAQQTALTYADVVQVNKATGDIWFTDHYPLKLKADVRVYALDDVYFDTLSVQAAGSLKRTTGQLTSQYNGFDVHGGFIAQGLDQDTPFSAWLDFDRLVLPYAKSQAITLSDGKITAEGTPKQIQLRINTDLDGVDIPKGRYHGRALVRDDGMDIHHLTAHTQAGSLTAQGELNWSDEFWMDTRIWGDGVEFAKLLSEDFVEYQDYLPKTLTGQLDFRYFSQDADKNTRFEIDLNQKDGESIQTIITQALSTKAPWHIKANWQNLKRQNLPQIGPLDSSSGQANILLADKTITVKADANITKLHQAPAGHYKTSLQVNDDQLIVIDDFLYQGILGELLGSGRIDISQPNKMLWRADLTSKKLTPNAYLSPSQSVPVENATGRLAAFGEMYTKGGMDFHDVTITDSDLMVKMVPERPSTQDYVHLIGNGKIKLGLKGDQIQQLHTRFSGDLEQSFLSQINKTNFDIDVLGNLSSLQIRHAYLNTPSGNIKAVGGVFLGKAIGWDIQANLDGVDAKKLTQDTNLDAVMTGDLVTKGAFADGKVSNLALQFSGELASSRFPSGYLGVDLTGDRDRFNLHHLSHRGQSGDLLVTGHVDLSKGIAWQLKTQMNDFNVAAFTSQATSRINGDFSSHGHWREDSQLLVLDDLNFQGRLNDQLVRASGSLYADLVLPKDMKGYLDRIKQTTRRPKSQQDLLNLREQVDQNARQAQNIVRKLQADKLTIHYGDNNLFMDGSDDQMTTNVDIKDLGQILPKANGVIKGGVILINDDNALPTLYVDMMVAGLRAPNVVIQDAKAIGKIVNLGNSDSQLLVQGNNIIVLGQVIKAARLDFSGTEKDHVLALSTKSLDIDGAVKIEGSFDRDALKYQGVLSGSRASGRFGEVTQNQPTEFSYRLDDNYLKVAAHCWQTKQTDHNGEICLQDPLSLSLKEGHVNLTVSNVDTRVFSAVLPRDIHWQSTLNGRTKLIWQAGKRPVVDAVLYSDNGRIGLEQEDTGYVEMPYKRVSVIAKDVTKGLQIRTDIDGVAGSGYADVVVNPYGEDKPISGALVLNDINLAVLRPFFPNLQALTGKINLAGGLGGSLSKPLFYGNTRLTDGTLALVGVPMILQNININGSIRGTQAKLEGGFYSGEGQGKITGLLDWQQELQAKIGISGENLDVNKPPLAIAQISPDLEVLIRPQQKFIDVQGVVIIPSATLRPPEQTASIVSESEDVSVLDRRLTGDIDQILAVAEPWNINANIGVDLGGHVEFRGFGARLPLAGAIHLTQSGNQAMQAKGLVQLSKRTKIDGFGQNLELNYVQIRFNGDVTNPRLSIEGQQQIEGQTVGLRIRGTAADPQITVFNDAGLSEQQAMNAFFTGRISEANESQVTEQGFRSQVTNHLAAAGLSFGLSGTRSLTNELGRALGLQSLTIDASGNSYDTNVNITGYITPDLYIRYGVGVFNAQTSLSMRYQLTRRVYVEATSATENLIDVIYRWKF